VKLTTWQRPSRTYRNQSDASRRARGAGVQTGVITTCGGNSEAFGGGTRLTLWTNIGRRLSPWVRRVAHVFRMVWIAFSANSIGRWFGP